MNPRGVRYLKLILFVLSLTPALLLLEGALSDALGTNPVETLVRDTGQWTLRFLLITLLISPLRQLTGQSQLLRLRRMLGLFAFFYALLHLSLYIGLDKFLYWDEILNDILDRPFITIGMLAFVLLVPLAITSTDAMMRRLGRNWVKLHKLVYVIAVAGVVHFYMLVKADVTEPVIYGLILAVLLMFRLPAIKRWRPFRA
ncbi:MAG: sulfoxide reductase heme-binding subunit YedZ [Gammaproteobacteria bacterium]|nr:sulfoxide reductase heme-binding subunit YedZ [Gammaproteobacteria bacterium]